MGPCARARYQSERITHARTRSAIQFNPIRCDVDARASLLLLIRERLLSTQLVSASMTGDYYSFYLILSTRRASRRYTTSLHYGYFAAAAAAAATRIDPHISPPPMLTAGVVSLFSFLCQKVVFVILSRRCHCCHKVLKCSNNCERLRRGIKKEKREVSLVYTQQQQRWEGRGESSR